MCIGMNEPCKAKKTCLILVDGQVAITYSNFCLFCYKIHSEGFFFFQIPAFFYKVNLGTLKQVVKISPFSNALPSIPSQDSSLSQSLCSK